MSLFFTVSAVTLVQVEDTSAIQSADRDQSAVQSAVQSAEDAAAKVAVAVASVAKFLASAAQCAGMRACFTITPHVLSAALPEAALATMPKWLADTVTEMEEYQVRD
jgi:predicted membrane-bound mannosyltransferase